MMIWFCSYDNPAAASEFPQRHLTYNYLLPLNFWLLLCPSWLCCDWTMGTVPTVDGFLDPRNVLTLGFYGGLFVMASCSLKNDNLRQRVVVMVSNCKYWFMLAEMCLRVLQIRSLGFCQVSCGSWHIHHNIC